MRSRSVVPHGVLRDTRLRRLSPVARRVYFCLWFAVSDTGTIEDDPAVVAAALDWYSAPPPEPDVRQAVADLVRARLLRRFKRDGRRWLWHCEMFHVNSGEWIAKNDHSPPPPWITLERDQHGHYRAKPLAPKGSGAAIDASMKRQRRVNDASLTLSPAPIPVPIPIPAPAPGPRHARAPAGSQSDPTGITPRDLPPEVRVALERARAGLAPVPTGGDQPQ